MRERRLEVHGEVRCLAGNREDKTMVRHGLRKHDAAVRRPDRVYSVTEHVQRRGNGLVGHRFVQAGGFGNWQRDMYKCNGAAVRQGGSLGCPHLFCAFRAWAAAAAAMG
jgi:hypothetical protein